MIVLRPYNTAGSVTFTLRQAGSDAFATSSHWTPAAGDVKLSLEGGTQANATNLPTFANGQWTLSLAATELQAARVRVNIDDVDIIPESILIETYGHASAAYPTAYADQWLGIASKITTDHGAGSYVDTGAGLDAAGVRGAVGLAAANLDTQLGAIPTTAPLDATATEAAAAAALAAYDAAAASDLSGLLTQSQFNAALPANFGTLSINASGEVVASNMVSPAPDSTAIQSAANAALVAYQTAKTTDLAGLLTQTYFDAALPGNFGVLSIDTSGNVSTTGGGSGALTPEQATWIEETHAKAMLIGTGGAVVQVPIDSDLNVTVRSYRDYDASDGLAIEWANTDGTWPDLTDATVVARVARPGCKAKGLYDFAASIVQPTGSQLVRLELTDEQLSIIADDYTYELVATLASDHVVTIADGQFRVILGRQAP